MRKFEVVTAFAHLKPEIPKRATQGSAGYDLSAIQEVTIKPWEIAFVPTGLKAMMQKDEVLLIYPRSSLAIKKGLMMSNSVGVIDQDYYGNKENEGHIMIPLINIKSHDVTIKAGERIAQGIFTNFNKTSDDEIKQATRQGGFGSSGH
ncbi:MAG: dUTP diphosphatase [Acholeplasmataceae bacterium]|jgi:dUTP pyrophosphatase|nr:dUTP diphosphatase [Acholeplasmataceae bacterium]